MSNLQAFFLGIMVFLTPSMLLLGFLLLPLPDAKKIAGAASEEADQYVRSGHANK
jgi:hypothetical protein